MMNTYNYHLYQHRKSQKYSIRKMANAIGISSFYYRLIENGYLKPSKKTVAKISEYLGEDYSIYMEGAASNPCDLPDKNPWKIVRAFYQIMASWITRGILIGLAVASLGVLISGFIVSNHLETHYRDYYDPEFGQFADEIREKGAASISLIGDLTYPQVYESPDDPNTGHTKFISLSSHYKDGDEFSINYKTIYRTDEYRIVSNFSFPSITNQHFLLTYTVTNYETTKRSYYYYEHDGQGALTYLLGEEGGPVFQTVQKCAESFFNDFDHLVQSKLTTHLTLPQIAVFMEQHHNMTYSSELYVILSEILGLIASGLFLFAVAFAFIYGVKKGQRMAFSRENVTVDEAPEPPLKPLKKDIRVTPFIPETVLEFVGIILVFIGSLRMVFYVGGFFGIFSLGNIMSNQVVQQYMGTFMVGMFLLYFLDFDIFLEDRRVARNIFLYAIVFFCLYFIEVSLLEALASDESLMKQLTDLIIIPNMFGSISCYFMIMLFLFFTPKWIKKPWQMVLYRCLAILPIGYLATAWILFHGNGVWFDLGWNRWSLYLFNGERLPFTVLAVSYLVGYYFIRLFFEKRYGKQNAQVFFNSNRFLLIKNGFMAIIICLVALAEFLFSSNPTALKMDIGHYSNLIFLAPLLFFYHPHKGPRNKAVDYVTLGSYILALVVAYLLIATVGLLGFVANFI